MKKAILYASYGSNMSVKQMRHRCPNASIVGDAVLKNWRLLFKVHATVERAEGYSVPVVLWSITPSDERNLDIYEGYPKYYRKDYVYIKVGESRRKVMLYVMNDRPLAVPYKNYFDVIAEAYGKFNFDISILNTAVEESRT